MTRSLPLARPSRASAFGRIPFAASQAAKVPHFVAERETDSRVAEFRGSMREFIRGILSFGERVRLCRVFKSPGVFRLNPAQ